MRSGHTVRVLRAVRTLLRRAGPDRPMDCAQVGRVLQAHLDGETGGATAQRVAAHLEQCRHCGLEARTYRAIKGALARRREPDPDAMRRLRGFGESLLRPDGD
ncbi:MULTISPECIES: anti-sigma factor [unclassified Streptomyces]|uniref:anti-sigma factor family protein n=1 Tax=unclassified Streptomyces TaxID=2593676 RepID=UPI001F1DE90F|nr:MULTISPECIES: zf-HC2 domain-containing protein [unclassified Streptomyces]